MINLTQHKAIPAQIAAGVVDLEGEQRETLLSNLTVSEGDIALLATGSPEPQREFLRQRADAIVRACVLPAIVEGIREELESGRPTSLQCAAIAAGSLPHGVSAMIGGAPYLMAPLEAALARVGVAVFYALSARKSVESVDADGRVTKTQVFEHAGFVRAAGA